MVSNRRDNKWYFCDRALSLHKNILRSRAAREMCNVKSLLRCNDMFSRGDTANREIASSIDDGEKTRNNAVRRFHVMSYGIGRSWNLLRHVYLVYKNVEIHPGMTNDGSSQLVFSTPNYFGDGRIEGCLLYCDVCADLVLRNMSDRSRRFHIVYNNCDTILPIVMQTALLWLSVVGTITGTLILSLRERSLNAFTFSFFVPLLAYVITMIYNKYDKSDRRNDILAICSHVKLATRSSNVTTRRTID